MYSDSTEDISPKMEVTLVSSWYTQRLKSLWET